VTCSQTPAPFRRFGQWNTAAIGTLSLAALAAWFRRSNSRTPGTAFAVRRAAEGSAFEGQHHDARGFIKQRASHT